MDFKKLGNRVREQRKLYKKTQEELAEAVDLSYPYIGQVERGIRGINIENLIKIASYLNVSVEYLLTDYIEDNTKKVEDEIDAEWLNLVAGMPPVKKKKLISLVKDLLKYID